MACNMKANDPGSGANRMDRIAALARDRRHAAAEDEADQMADVANNQANMFIRNNLANMAAAADILENLAGDNREEEDGEPSNFQAWYVRSANNSRGRSRDRSEARLEQEQESEPDQDMEDGMEELGLDHGDAAGDRDTTDPETEAAFERLEYDRTDRFDRNMFRSLSLEQAEGPAPADNLAMMAGSPSLAASLPSNHNPFLGEPGAGNSGNGNFGGAIPRRNSGYVRNVNQGPGTLYNWQATKTTVKERFAFMFNNEILADVHFKVKRSAWKSTVYLILLPRWGGAGPSRGSPPTSSC